MTEPTILTTIDALLRALANVEGYVAEMFAAGEDATRPFRKRAWSRHRARRRIERARNDAKEEIARARTELLAARGRATAEGRCQCNRST